MPGRWRKCRLAAPSAGGAGGRYDRGVPAIRDGQITVYYLFEIAEAVDLAAVPPAFGGQTATAHFSPKPAAPAHVQYQAPPLLVDGDAFNWPELEGFRVRARIYNYGVVSLALTRPFEGEWTDLLAWGQQLIGPDHLERSAHACAKALADRIAPALDQPRAAFLVEDYVVFGVTAFESPVTAETLLDQHGIDIAHILRGEPSGLSRQERDDVLRHRLSYLENDLAVPTWNAAFVYDTPAGLQAALEIFEFANSQLLEFRYYDAWLDSELARIYADLQKPRWYDVFGRRRLRAANQLHSLFIDVNELTDKMENALKLVGDVYAARLYGLIAARLGLERWKANVEEKLETLDDIYRFAVEQLQVARGHLLELTIIVILIFELVLFFLGIMT